jgi:hypothetical protein
VTAAPARPLVLLLAVLTAGCASLPTLDEVRRTPAPAPLLRFGEDTLAFANESRSKNRGKPDLYANWCFVMVRAVRQFHLFARFDPQAPRLTPAEYTERVRQVTARPPWHAPLPADDRVLIPGYASLYEFSRHQTAAVKAGLSGRFWSWIHWTNWRVALPVPRAQQERVARETLVELQAGRPVQWLVTNLPTIELNHTVLVYDYRVTPDGSVEFVVYDPNDPHAPGLVRWDAADRRFWATRLFDTRVGPIRAFRMYYSPLL